MPKIPVTLTRNDYEIHIEPGLLPAVGRMTRSLLPRARAALLAVDERIHEVHGRVVADSLLDAGIEAVIAPLKASEREKTLETARRLYGHMLEARLDRTAAVIALGGGVVGDVAGFAAATYLRGVGLIQVPTTLLAMVDASIGGKTGVNIELPSGRLGKNLIGAFWQPRGVLADPETLNTLDDRDLRCGLAESIKHALIADASMLEELRALFPAVMARDRETLTRLIERSARVKVDIVAGDEREGGRRALLNLGHTFAHAIEPIEALDLRHGEAVAIGLCAAARIAVMTGRLREKEEELIRAAITEAGLPTALAQPVEAAGLLETMMFDKKVASGVLRLIVPEGLGAATIVEDVPREAIIEAWRSVGAAVERGRRAGMAGP